MRSDNAHAFQPIPRPIRLLGLVLCAATILGLAGAAQVASSQAPGIVPAGIGLAEEGARPADPTPPVEQSRTNPSLALAVSPYFTHGVFSGPTAWNTNRAAFYKNQAQAIANGTLESKVEFFPQEISSWDPDTYLTGGMAYAVTVISGLQRGDIVHRSFRQQFTYDYASGLYSDISAEDPVDKGSGDVYILIDDYKHNAGTNRIVDWINYITREPDGSYTLVMGQSIYWLLPDRDILSMVIGYGFRLFDDFEIYRGATLVNPQISSRGYRFSVAGVASTNGAVIASQSYVDRQNVVAAPVVPLLECVAEHADGTLTAHFGYENRNPFATTIFVGSENFFSPSPANRGQPVTFAPGRTAPFPDNPVSVTFAAGETLAWTLDGTTITASASSPACPPVVPVQPILECVAPDSAGAGYTAFFGYHNANDYVVRLPVGVRNSFDPAPADRGQPTAFVPGRQESVFSAQVDAGDLSWTLGDQVVTATRAAEACEPTAVTLVSFTADVVRGRVELNWETGTEIDNAGFNLYRATTADGTYRKINPALIAAEGDPLGGATYTFVDTPGAGVFYYMLEDVDYNGVTTRYGPVRAQVGPAPAQGESTIYLPLVSRE